MSQPLEKVVKKRAEWLADTNPIPGHILAVVEETGECRLGNDSATFTQLLNMNPSGVKIYRATLTQATTSAPVATVLENTLGGELVWSRDFEGQYSATLAGAFTGTTAKVAVSFTYGTNNLDPTVDGIIVAAACNNADVILFYARAADGTAADLNCGDAAVHIIVYP